MSSLATSTAAVHDLQLTYRHDGFKNALSGLSQWHWVSVMSIDRGMH